jgi:hypothetical protein
MHICLRINRVFFLIVLCCSYNAFAQLNVTLGASLRYARPNSLTNIIATQVQVGINKNKHSYNVFYITNLANPKYGGAGFEYDYTFISKKKFEIAVQPEACFWFTPITYNIVNASVPAYPDLYNKNAISCNAGICVAYKITPHISLKLANNFGWCYSYNRIPDEINDKFAKKYADKISSYYYHFQIGLISTFKI